MIRAVIFIFHLAIKALSPLRAPVQAALQTRDRHQRHENTIEVSELDFLFPRLDYSGMHPLLLGVQVTKTNT